MAVRVNPRDFYTALPTARLPTEVEVLPMQTTAVLVMANGRIAVLHGSGQSSSRLSSHVTVVFTKVPDSVVPFRWFGLFGSTLPRIVYVAPMV